MMLIMRRVLTLLGKPIRPPYRAAAVARAEFVTPRLRGASDKVSLHSYPNDRLAWQALKPAPARPGSCRLRLGPRARHVRQCGAAGWVPCESVCPSYANMPNERNVCLCLCLSPHPPTP
jgi:hypothetical protein